jgi:hypothetical protein
VIALHLRRVGADWRHVHDASDRDVVADVLASWGEADTASTLDLPDAARPEHGDLVRVVDACRDDLHVWDDARDALVPVPHPRAGASLVAWWEGAADAREMLRACARVDRRRLVLAACDCAETVQRLVPAGEDGPRRAPRGDDVSAENDG